MDGPETRERRLHPLRKLILSLVAVLGLSAYFIVITQNDDKRLTNPLHFALESNIKDTDEEIRQMDQLPRTKGRNSVNRNSTVLSYMDIVKAETGWSPYMDTLDESTALKDPPLTDINKGVDVRFSKVYLLASKNFFEVGDTVNVRIDLFDGYGKRRQRGGDQLRVRIFEDTLGASASGYVLDHQNGSYTAVVKCLWIGTPTVLVYISYTREAVRALYHIRSTLPATRDICVKYKSGVTGRCHAFSTQLSQSATVCNMTLTNGNMSWYCQGPTKESCGRVASFFRKDPVKLPVTVSEEKLFTRNGEHLNPVVNIVVKEKSSPPNGRYSKPPCVSFNRTKLWFQASPTGHFMHDKWEPELCKAPPTNTFFQCLRNKHLLLYGDSTIRQWFSNIFNRSECNFTTEPWKEEKWKKDSAAFCPSLNLTLEWIVHSLPGNLYYKKISIKNISELMLKYARQKSVIFVIHLFCHLSSYHHDVFRDRISYISKNVKKVLKINPDAKIFIKGGHTFKDFRQNSDYYGYVYRTITIEEFAGLYDKVTYLDNKDITIAKEVIPNHPQENVVREMVNQMLSYICN